MWRGLVLVILFALSGAVRAEETRGEKLDRLFAALHTADRAEAAELEDDIWTAWLESGSPTVDLLMRRGLLAQERGALSEARDLFSAALRLEPAYAEAWNRRASVYLQEENTPSALADIGETLKLEPRHFGALVALGVILEKLDKKKAALEAYRSALKLYPQLEDARAGVARLEPMLDGRPL
jgi:tetratricopeptide (TPR) repeat protein